MKGTPDKKALSRLRAGVELEDGRTQPAKVDVVGRKGKNTYLDLTIHEGKKRQVKRMCEAVGYPVIRLHRSSFGPLELGDLPMGSYRILDAGEVDALRRASK